MNCIVGTTYTDVGGNSTAKFAFEDEFEFFRCAAKYWIPRVRSNPSAEDFAIVYMCERPNGRITTKYFIGLLLVIKRCFIIILLLDFHCFN